jgi:hypothetical protein
MRGILNRERTAGRFALCLALLAALGATRAEAAVRAAQAALSSSQALVGEAIQLQVQVSSDKKEDLPWPKVEGLESFTVSKNVSYSSSSNITVVNGAVSRNEQFITDFIYTLTPQKSGTFTIGPIRYDHRDFHQDLGSAVLTVSKSESGLSTRSSVSKSRAFVGEQVLFTLRIVPKEGVQSISLPQDLQKLIGQKVFFQQLDKEIAPHTAMVEGRETKVFDIRIALFPLIAGPMALEGIPVEYRQVRRNPGSQGQSMMEAFEEAFFGGGGGRVVTQTALAAPLRMEALPLPGGAPAGFTGSVGNYSLSARLDKDAAAAGDAVTLTIKIRGNGQPKSITRPVLPSLPYFEIYDPEESSETVVEGASLWTTKTFKYVLIPSREGLQTLQGISFPYFDPQRRSYVTAEAPPLTLKVAPGKPGTGGGFVAQREISEVGSDIRYLKQLPAEGALLRDDANLPYHHAGFYGLVLLPPLAFAGALWLRRRRDRLRSDTAYSRRAQAGSKLRKRLKAARAAQAAGQGREVYRALSESLLAFAGDKLNQEFRGLTHPEARLRLEQRGAAPETAAAYDALMQRCDFVLFAGMQPSEDEIRRDLDAGEKLLDRLDKELA